MLVMETVLSSSDNSDTSVMTDISTQGAIDASRRRLLTAIAAAGGVSLAGCTSDDGNGDGGNGGSGNGGGGTSVSLGIGRGAWDLIPARDTDFDSNKVYSLIYNNLVDITPEGEYVPQLASDWELESDTQYVFELEEGVTFHNGEDFTASDVQYTYEWIETEENPRKNYVSAIEEVVVEDDYTVRFDLAHPHAPFLDNVEKVMWPLSEAAVTEYGEDYNSNPVGTGPYELVEWNSGQNAILRKYDDYWQDDLPNIDEIEFRILPDESSMVSQLETGSIQAVDQLSPQYVDQVESADGISVMRTEDVSSGRVDFNTDVEPLDDRRVRRAIAWAIDKEQIVETVLQGYGEAGKSILPSSFAAYNGDLSDFNHPNGDPQQAQDLLAEAGHEDLSLEIISSTTTQHEQAATLIQSMLEDIGVEASVQTLDGSTFWTREQEGDFEIAVSNWESFADPDELLYLHHTDGLNVWNISNDELDALLEDQRETPDQEDRQELLDEIQQIVYEEAYSVYTYYPERIQGVSDRLEGFEQYPHGSFRSLHEATYE